MPSTTENATTSSPLRLNTRKKVRQLAIKGIAKAVLLALLDHVNARDFEATGRARCWPSRETLAHETGFCSRSIFTALKHLAHEHLISISNQGEYRSNTYIIDLDMIIKRASVTQVNGSGQQQGRQHMHGGYAPDAQSLGTGRITPVHHMPTNKEANKGEKVITEPARNADEITTTKYASSVDQTSISALSAENKLSSNQLVDGEVIIPYTEKCIEWTCKNRKGLLSNFCDRCSSQVVRSMRQPC